MDYNLYLNVENAGESLRVIIELISLNRIDNSQLVTTFGILIIPIIPINQIVAAGDYCSDKAN